MKAIYQKRYGKPDVLTYGEQPQPTLEANQVLVKNYATSVNPRDCLIRAGKYQLQFLVRGFPLILGSDFAGCVVKTGDNVRHFQVGDRVYGMKNPSHGLATYAEYVSVDQQHLSLVPASLDYEHAAAVPLCALTAWQALFDKASMQAGDRILIIGASGGVGSFATQLGDIHDAQVSAVCSQKNAELVRSLGADNVICYDQQNLTEIKQQFDIVFDTIGILTPSQIKARLTAKGRFVTTVPSAQILPKLVISKAARMLGINKQQQHLVMVRPDARQLDQISLLIQQQRLAPLIDQTFAMDEAASAHQRSQSKRACGKIVIRTQ